MKFLKRVREPLPVDADLAQRIEAIAGRGKVETAFYDRRDGVPSERN